MPRKIEVRESTAADRDAIAQLYRDAFPEEDLQPLVTALLDAADLAVLSLVAVTDDGIAGHVLFTPCSLGGSEAGVALLGPLAVAPEQQRRGVGKALVHAGLERLRTAGVGHVFVLGDPDYYGRLGFETEEEVVPPYPLADAWQSAWQSVRLHDDVTPARSMLHVPGPWQHAELWALPSH